MVNALELTRLARRAGCSLLWLAALLVLGSCASGTPGGGVPTALFKIVVSGTGVAGTYVWDESQGTEGAYVQATGGSSYIFNSFDLTGYSDGTTSGAQHWFLSASLSTRTPATDSVGNANVAVPASSGWTQGVVTSVDYTHGAAFPTAFPDNPIGGPGATLTVGYTYSGPGTDNPGATRFQWQRASGSSSPTDASFSDIPGATSSAYTTGAGDRGNYDRVVVTVTSSDGTVGTPSVSQPVYVP